jgi:hypothetical protein
MTLTDENEAITVCQATQHAMLIPWGRFSRLLGLSERLRAAVVLPRHQDATPGGDLILEFGLASLAGYEYLQDLNLGLHPRRDGPICPSAAQVATQVRVAAKTSAVVLTNTQGQMLVFDAHGPYAGVQIPLDRPFAYQFPMPLFQTWRQLWPVSSESLKEQLATMVANQNRLYAD